MNYQKLSKILASVVIGLTLTGCSSQATSKNNDVKESFSISKSNGNEKNSQDSISGKDIGGLTNKEYTQLSNKKFQNDTYGYVDVNGGKSTLNPKAWQKNKVIYSNLDNLNRTSKPNVGFLEKRNLANGSLRVRQYIQPTGWHYNTRNGEQLYNRGHLIAYSVSAGIDQNGNYNPQNQSGDQNNPKNLFTQTAYANQQLQTIYEKKVRNALRENKKVIYQATAIFKGNEKMARGVNLQAISTDGSLNFNVYVYNVQNGFKFNYADGSAKKDGSVVVKELPASLQSHYNDSKRNQHNSFRYKSRNKQKSKYRIWKNNSRNEWRRNYERRKASEEDDDYF